MSLILSPLQLSGTNASDLLGSFVLLSSISAVYFAVAMLVLRLARRFGDQEGDAPDMRVFKAKLFLWYPRVPMTVAVQVSSNPRVVAPSCWHVPHWQLIWVCLCSVSSALPSPLPMVHTPPSRLLAWVHWVQHVTGWIPACPWHCVR